MDSEKKIVLVTGGSGLVGSAIKQLINEEKSNNELLETAKELIFFKLQNEKFVKFNEKNLKCFFEKIYESCEADNQCDSSSFSTDSDETYYLNDEDSDQSVSTGFKKDFSYFL